MSDTEPCPFCGSLKLVVEDNDDFAHAHYWVVCDNCDAEGPIGISDATAKAAWNKRSDPTRHPIQEP